jgi:periplasmic protein CpxP/Spy
MSESEPVTPVTTPTPPRRTNAKWIAALVVIVAFATGILVGIAASHLMMRRGHRPHIPGRAAHFMVERLDRRLDLTDEQEKKIEEIIARRHARIEQVWGSVRPRVRAEIDATNDEIAKILTPEQRVAFEKIKMRVNGGRPPGRHRGRD